MNPLVPYLLIPLLLSGSCSFAQRQLLSSREHSPIWIAWLSLAASVATLLVASSMDRPTSQRRYVFSLVTGIVAGAVWRWLLPVMFWGGLGPAIFVLFAGTLGALIVVIRLSIESRASKADITGTSLAVAAALLVMTSGEPLYSLIRGSHR